MNNTINNKTAPIQHNVTIKYTDSIATQLHNYTLTKYNIETTLKHNIKIALKQHYIITLE